MKKALKRDSFIFYRSFYEAIKELDFEQQGRVYDAIFRFALNGEEVKLNGVEKAVFTLIKPQVLANNQRFENGCRGGRPKGSKSKQNDNQLKTDLKPNRNQANVEKQTKIKPNENGNVNVNENDNVNLNVGVIKDSRLVSQKLSPTLSQVEKVCKDLGFDKSVAKTFFNFYEANGWMQGRDKPIVNWIAQLNIWVTREYEFYKTKSAYLERQYTREELDSMFDNLENVEI